MQLYPPVLLETIEITTVNSIDKCQIMIVYGNKQILIIFQLF